MTNTSAESAQRCCGNSVTSLARAGQHHFVADVLAENYAMRRVINDAGWPTTQHRDGSVFSVEVNLDDIEDSAESHRISSTGGNAMPPDRRTAATTFGGDRGLESLGDPASMINVGIVRFGFIDEEADMTSGVVVSVITAAVFSAALLLGRLCVWSSNTSAESISGSAE